MSLRKDPKQKGSYARHDAFYFAAKKAGYAARSVFKLDEIDKDFKLLRAGDVVLDLGCSPGSWVQYTCDKIGPKGIIVGVDLLPLKVSAACTLNFVKADIFEVPSDTLLAAIAPNKGFNVLLSDMAPNTSGIKSVDQDRSLGLCERALEIAKETLRPGGRFCVKILEGGGMHEYIKQCRATFEEVKIRTPQGTRAASMETYVIGLRKK